MQRITSKPVTFQYPFTLDGVDGRLEAGTYEVETCEELIQGLSFVAYRRISTTIELRMKGYGHGARQVITIDPSDLEDAQRSDIRDAEVR